MGHLQAAERYHGPLTGPEGWAVPACSTGFRPLANGGREGVDLVELYAEGRRLCPECIKLFDGQAKAEFDQLMYEGRTIEAEARG